MASFLSIAEYECAIIEAIKAGVGNRAKVEGVHTLTPGEYMVTVEKPVCLVMFQGEFFQSAIGAGVFPRELTFVVFLGVRSLKVDGAHLGAYALLDCVRNSLVGQRVLSASPERSVPARLSPKDATYIDELNGVFWYSLTVSFLDRYHRSNVQ